MYPRIPRLEIQSRPREGMDSERAGSAGVPARGCRHTGVEVVIPYIALHCFYVG